MRRREFITFLGGAAAAWPFAAHAQQPAMPVIGLLEPGSSEGSANWIAATRQGLSETGYVEGRNVAIEYRYAEGKYDRLPILAAELIQRQPTLLFAGGLPAALALKAATVTIPIVFISGPDPVRLGLVTSLNKPGSNMTGVTLFTTVLVTKRLELLRELVPAAVLIGYIVNPNNPRASSDIDDVEAGARALGQQITVLEVRSDSDFDGLFANIRQRGVRALLVGNDPFLNSRAQQLAALVARHAMPAIYGLREYAVAGGLMSYATRLNDSYRDAGVYIGRILNGEKPGNLPVMQPTKFELVINLKTAKALDLDVPATLLARADEVIE
jgi:putative ABC transport system substrate-binding protein